MGADEEVVVVVGTAQMVDVIGAYGSCVDMERRRYSSFGEGISVIWVASKNEHGL